MHVSSDTAVFTCTHAWMETDVYMRYSNTNISSRNKKINTCTHRVSERERESRHKYKPLQRPTGVRTCPCEASWSHEFRSLPPAPFHIPPVFLQRVLKSSLLLYLLNKVGRCCFEFKLQFPFPKDNRAGCSLGLLPFASRSSRSALSRSRSATFTRFCSNPSARLASWSSFFKSDTCSLSESSSLFLARLSWGKSQK